ncbi:MAG: RNA polymerase sigma factor [Candidatus Limnocylindria bacterium]
MERWEDLYRISRPTLYRTAALMVGDAEAEEVVQDAFERGMRQPHFFATVKCPEAWLRTAVVRLAVSRIRRRGLWARVRERLQPASAPAHSEALDLKMALPRLSERQRGAIVMRYFHGASYDDIADALGVSADTVGSLLSRAREALRETLR